MKALKFFILIIFLIPAMLYKGRSYAQQDSIQPNLDQNISVSSLTISKPESYEKINFSGDNQHITAGETNIRPLLVLVNKKDGSPAINIPVKFALISCPGDKNNVSIIKTTSLTDSSGYASTKIKTGDVPGDYEISASIESDHEIQFVVFNLNLRKKNWWILLSISMLGGLGLFLFGMHMMSEGMQKSAGDKMRSILSKLTKNRIIGLGLGAFVTMIIQSSSATTVMLVSFVQSGLMRFRRTIAVMLGAAIGTTITAQIIAFKLSDYSLLFVAVGAGFLFFSKKNKIKHIAEAILGFGLIFFGMAIMSDAVYPLRTYEPFLNTLVSFENPALGILAGVAFTAIIQSSSASIGVLIILASQGLLSLEASIPLILGANLGTAITAILASLNTNREAKKVAYTHTLIKIIGLLIFVWWIPQMADLVHHISPSPVSQASNYMEESSKILPRQIANTHTIFNIILGFIVLPFTSLIAKFMDWIMPRKVSKSKHDFELQYLDKNLLKTPALALNAAKQETLRMIGTVQKMVKEIVIVFFENDKELLKKIAINEKETDYLRDKIKEYLINITQGNVEKERVNEAFQIMYTIKELEQIADIISGNLYKRAQKWIHSDKKFSEEGMLEIKEYQIKALKQISRAMEVFREVNLEKAIHMKNKYKKYAEIARNLERKHYERLAEHIDESIC
ncbi:MAG: hypothetical protein C0594_06825, partial [Marinilabiliales bacterium]